MGHYDGNQDEEDKMPAPLYFDCLGELCSCHRMTQRTLFLNHRIVLLAKALGRKLAPLLSGNIFQLENNVLSLEEILEAKIRRSVLEELINERAERNFKQAVGYPISDRLLKK